MYSGRRQQSSFSQDWLGRGDEKQETQAFWLALLEKLELTTPEETEVICSAIWHHDNKAETDGPMDEVLKDADVIDHSLSDPTKEIKQHERERYLKLCDEFGLQEKQNGEYCKTRIAGRPVNCGFLGRSD